MVMRAPSFEYINKTNLVKKRINLFQPDFIIKVASYDILSTRRLNLKYWVALIISYTPYSALLKSVILQIFPLSEIFYFAVDNMFLTKFHIHIADLFFQSFLICFINLKQGNSSRCNIVTLTDIPNIFPIQSWNSITTCCYPQIYSSIIEWKSKVGYWNSLSDIAALQTFHKISTMALFPP